MKEDRFLPSIAKPTNPLSLCFLCSLRMGRLCAPPRPIPPSVLSPTQPFSSTQESVSAHPSPPLINIIISLSTGRFLLDYKHAVMSSRWFHFCGPIWGGTPWEKMALQTCCLLLVFSHSLLTLMPLQLLLSAVSHFLWPNQMFKVHSNAHELLHWLLDLLCLTGHSFLSLFTHPPQFSNFSLNVRDSRTLSQPWPFPSPPLLSSLCFTSLLLTSCLHSHHLPKSWP